MPTYVYETIPDRSDETPDQFEVKQSMNDEPLRVHPETGKPVRRVITGGYGYLSSSGSSDSSPSGGSCGCGGCGCSH